MVRKRALVTGGGGFIGKHLAYALCSLYNVDVVDNREFTDRCDLPTYIPKMSIRSAESDDRWYQWTFDGNAVSAHQLSYHDPVPPGFNYLKADCASPAVLQLISAGNYDVIFHLAAQASVPLCERDPIGSADTNLMTTIKLLDAVAKSKRVTRFIFSSSAAVYGNDPKRERKLKPAKEDSKCIPTSLYGMQKLSSENFLQHYCHTRGVLGVSLRYFNVFGPDQPADSPFSSVVARWCRAITLGEPLEFNGDIDKIYRDFVSVNQVVRANMAFINAPPSLLTSGQVFNVGSGHALSLRDLFQRLEKSAGRNLSFNVLDRRSADISYSCADVTKLKELYRMLGIVFIDDTDVGLDSILSTYAEEVKSES